MPRFSSGCRFNDFKLPKQGLCRVQPCHISATSQARQMTIRQNALRSREEFDFDEDLEDVPADLEIFESDVEEESTEGVSIPQPVVDVLKSVAEVVKKNPGESLVAAGAFGFAITSTAAINNFVNTAPQSLMALEELLGIAVCAYYIPKYTLSSQNRKELQAKLASIWTKATGTSSPFIRKEIAAIDDGTSEDEQFERLAASEVMAAVDDVLAAYNTTLPLPVRDALTQAIQQIRLEDIRYRQDYKILAEEFEKLVAERNELKSLVESMEKKLSLVEQEYLKQTDRVSQLEGELRSTELEADVVLKRTKEALDTAAKEAEDARQEREKLAEQLSKSSSIGTTKRMEAQIKALKARLEEALDDQETAQQKAMDAEKQLVKASQSLNTRVESLKSQLEIARLMETAREEEATTLQKELDDLVDEDALEATKAVSLDEFVETVQANVEAKEETTSKGGADVLSKIGQGAEAVLNTLSGKPTKPKVSEGADKRKALSRMNKTELKAECEERGIEVDGKVAELRVKLRAARKIADASAKKKTTRRSRSKKEA